ERGATHPEQDEQLEARPSLVGEFAQLADAFLHPFRLVEPSEPHLPAGVRPDGRVARPDALDELPARGAGQPDTNPPAFDSMRCFSSSSESVNFCTPSRSSVSVTSS